MIKELSQSMIKAAGLLRDRKEDLERHLEEMRSEWETGMNRSSSRKKPVSIAYRHPAH